MKTKKSTESVTACRDCHVNIKKAENLKKGDFIMVAITAFHKGAITVEKVIYERLLLQESPRALVVGVRQGTKVNHPQIVWAGQGGYWSYAELRDILEHSKEEII